MYEFDMVVSFDLRSALHAFVTGNELQNIEQLV